MAKNEFTGVNLTLPLCRLSFPVLFEQKYNELKKKDEWSVTMLFKKDETDLTKLKNALIRAAKLQFGEDVDLKTLDLKRIIDGDEKDRAEYKGHWLVKAATGLRQPGVVDAQLNKILDPTEIYSGVWAHVNVTAKAYTAPNQGVTLYLNHVQKVRDGEQIAGGPKAADVFEELDIDVADGDQAGFEEVNAEEANLFG